MKVSIGTWVKIKWNSGRESFGVVAQTGPGEYNIIDFHVEIFRGDRIDVNRLDDPWRGGGYQIDLHRFIVGSVTKVIPVSLEEAFKYLKKLYVGHDKEKNAH